jgi:ABC-type multidrug transport system permease subunit
MRPFEYLVSQILSRVIIMLLTTAIVYAGCSLLYGFRCKGSYALLFLVFMLGSFSMISMGLLVAARISSEELAGGVLNIISWPMMFLSGVWFSLEGSKHWVLKMADTFPLTHLIEAARKIMTEGAGIYEIRHDLINMTVMSVLFLLLGSLLFDWKRT